MIDGVVPLCRLLRDLTLLGQTCSAWATAISICHLIDFCIPFLNIFIYSFFNTFIGVSNLWIMCIQIEHQAWPVQSSPPQYPIHQCQVCQLAQVSDMLSRHISQGSFAFEAVCLRHLSHLRLSVVLTKTLTPSKPAKTEILQHEVSLIACRLFIIHHLFSYSTSIKFTALLSLRSHIAIIIVDMKLILNFHYLIWHQHKVKN